jgi:hypothetical protein
MFNFKRPTLNIEQAAPRPEFIPTSFLVGAGVPSFRNNKECRSTQPFG